MKMMKNRKFAKLFAVLFTAAVMMSLCAVTAFAAAGGSEAAYQSTITFFITWFITTKTAIFMINTFGISRIKMSRVFHDAMIINFSRNSSSVFFNNIRNFSKVTIHI